MKEKFVFNTWLRIFKNSSLRGDLLEFRTTHLPKFWSDPRAELLYTWRKADFQSATPYSYVARNWNDNNL